MYKKFQQLCEQLLRIPPEPGPPPGDEQSTRIFRAAPNFYRYLLIVWALVSLGAFLPVGVLVTASVAGYFALAKDDRPWAWLALVAVPLLLGGYVLVRLFFWAVLRLDYDKRWYVITDRSLRVREGVVNVKEMTVTFANIQNISISQGPIQRLLGIADLRVDTAGGGGATDGQHGAQNLHTAWFRGINNASEVRELIQRRLKHLKDSGLGDRDEIQSVRGITPTAEIIIALREVCTEARALREAAAR
jgi:uncharacterized membrane protein YdbT with pleckstrin-like domain